MFALISSLASGLMSGVISPLFTWLNKKQDTELEGFQAGVGADAATYGAYLQAYVQVQQLKAAQNSAPIARAIGGAAGALSVFYYGAIVLDSVFHLGWQIAKMPGQWDSDAWIIMQSFIVVAPVLPVTTAVASWLHRK